ncbi:MAG TPA: hypothetical protein VKG91_16660 [Roseiarcus sp.]|nr:hypothetical protein [Roseiarcus sp.]
MDRSPPENRRAGCDEGTGEADPQPVIASLSVDIATIYAALRRVTLRYDVKVLRDDEIVAAECLVVADLRDVWPKIARMADEVDEPGCQICVTEEAGGIAILIGATAARGLFKPWAPSTRTPTVIDAPFGRSRAII